MESHVVLLTAASSCVDNVLLSLSEVLSFFIPVPSEG